MNQQANQLRRAVEDRKNYLIHRLWKMGYGETPDGKRTEELTLTELEQIHINVSFRIVNGLDQS